MQPLIAAARTLFLLMLLGVGAAARTLPLIPGILPNLQLAKIGSVTAIIAESDGRVVVAGDFISIDGISRRYIARLHADASLDANWGVPLPGPVRVVATNDSSIFVLCQVTNASFGSSRGRVFKLSRADGALDPLWQADVGSDSVSGLAVSGSDVFISGEFSSVNGRQKSRMAKLSAHGAGVVDLGWNVSLVGWSASFLSVSGTNLYLAGSFESVNGLKRAGFARVRTTGVGAVDPSWVPPEVGRWPYSIQIEGDHVYSPDSLLRQVIRIPVAGDGSPDPQWGTGPLPSDAWLTAFHVSGTNIYLGVNHLGDAQVTRRSLAAPSLAVPGGWQVTVQPGYSVELIQAAGTNVFVAGLFDRVGEQLAFGLARLGAELPFPNALTSFTPRIEWPGAVFALALEANGGLIVGGDFGVANGVRRRNLARVDPHGSLDLSWNPEPDFPVKHLLIHSNSLFAATDFVFVDPSMPRPFVKVDLATGAIDDTWEWEPPVLEEPRVWITDLAVAGTNLFVAQAMNENSIRRGRVAKVSTEDGAADPDWKLETVPSSWSWVESLLVVGTNLFVGGDFSRIGSVEQNHLARVSLCGTGSVDASFSPDPSGMVIELASDGVHLFAAGYFDHIGGLFRTNMAKLDIQTGQAFGEWNSGTNYGDRMAVDGTNVYVSRLDGTYGNPVMHVVRLSTLTGAIDPAWQIAPNIPPDGLRNNRLRTRSVHAIAVRSETIYIGGDFDLMSGLTRHGLAAFYPSPGRPWLRYPRFESNRFECEVVAEPGRSFRIESSPDFATWSTLTNILPATPSLRISVPAHEDVRFYRSR